MCLLPYTGMRDFKDTEISCERHAHFGADIQVLFCYSPLNMCALGHCFILLCECLSPPIETLLVSVFLFCFNLHDSRAVERVFSVW